MTRDIIIKFLNNRCSEAELDEVIKWANKKEAFTKEDIALVFDEWILYQEGADLGEDERFSLLFDKIRDRIIKDNQRHRTMSDRQGHVLAIFSTWLTRVAAILLVPILTFLFYTLAEKKVELAKYTSLTRDSLEVIVPIGARTVVQLPDGSEVHLNYGSKIKYPQIFSGNTREVALSGEGYFNVAHDSQKPFIVKTGKLNITALGTVFNVMAYPDHDVVETTLVNGKVVLNQIKDDEKIEVIGTMVPGEHINYNTRTGAIVKTEGNLEKYIAWKDGKLVFEDTPISQVAEKLNLMFHVDIEVSADIKDYLYTVTFKDEPLSQILDLMAIASPVSYKVLPREKLADGSFSNQKIILSKRSH